LSFGNNDSQRMRTWYQFIFSQSHLQIVMRLLLKYGGGLLTGLGASSNDHVKTGAGVALMLVGWVQSAIAQKNMEAPQMTYQTATTGVPNSYPWPPNAVISAPQISMQAIKEEAKAKILEAAEQAFLKGAPPALPVTSTNPPQTTSNPVPATT